ncbi:MAG: zinc ribbon domain-containing protein [Candidatus Ranarchaeia archaeon]
MIVHCKIFNFLVFRRIINHCISNNIGMIVVGYNKGWKQKIDLGKRNNQNYVLQIEYKSLMVGIKVVRVSEEFTSQTCSPYGVVRKSNRKFRGLYMCKDCGSILNADVNASINILRKGVPESKSIWLGDRECLNHPLVLTV